MTLSSSITDRIAESISLERSGDYAAALQRAQTALQQARDDADAVNIAEALNRVAVIQFRLGHYDRAKSTAAEALTFAAPDACARADTWNTLGNIASETISFSEAESFFRLENELARDIGYPYARQRALHNLATNVYIPRGQFDLALTADKEAVRIAREQNQIEWAIPTLTTIAWNYQMTGQHVLAHLALDELDQVASCWTLAVGNSLWIKGNLALDENDPHAALPLIEKASAIAEDLGDTSLNVYARMTMSRYHRALDDFPNAYAWANDAVIYAERIGYRPLRGMALIERGRASWALGDVPSAGADLNAAIEILTPLQAAFDLTRAWLVLAAMWREQSKPPNKSQSDKAIECWRNAARGIVAGGYAFLLDQERALAFPLVASYLNHPDADAATLAATLLEQLERVPALPLHISTLGRFEVRQGCRTIPERAWQNRHAGELFRLLLVSPGHALAVDQITEALRSSKSPRSADEFLHQATSALRHVLEPELPAKFPSRYLKVEGERVCLRLPPGSRVDYEIFEQQIQMREWNAALALYQGDLFAGDRYADWATVPRERLSRHYIQALLTMATERFAAGRAQDALDACHRVLECEPWHENAVWLGMRAYLALNDRAGALQLYHELARKLKEELDVSPQPALQEFYQSLH